MRESVGSILIIGKVWPESKSSAAGSRMMQLIDIFSAHEYAIHFASAASMNENSDDLKNNEVKAHEIKLNDSSFDIFIKELNPSIVMFDRFMTEEQYGWRVAEQCPAAIRILDSEDLHCLRTTRQKKFKEGVTFQPEFMFQEEITKRELASIYRSDLTLIISSYEMKLLKEYFQIIDDSLFYLPFLHSPIIDQQSGEWPAFEYRRGFVMIGNYLHEPNRDAIKWLEDSIWPLIRAKLPDSELKVYGSYISQEGFEMDNRKDGFHICGRAEDLKQVISQARVMLAPLRFGAGLKGKLFDAMVYGTPSVTTTMGAEGISDVSNWCGAVSDAADTFADAAVGLYLNKNAWVNAQKRGIKIINDGFLMNDYDTPFIEKLNELILNIEVHRNNRFIGSMLMHHSMAGSKYMSKWIEEKNKRGK